jgi:hypothetical protein
VAQLRREPRFAEEHLDEIRRIGKLRQNSLDRNAPIKPLEPALLCEKHLGHPAARDSPQEDVLAEPNAGAIRSHATILSGSARTRRAVEDFATAVIHVIVAAPRSRSGDVFLM